MDNLKKNQTLLHAKTKKECKCEICDKEFKNIYGLKRHFDVVHKFEKDHQCNICQKKFMLDSQLTSHLKIVHENKKHHKCNSGSKSFSLPGNINSVHNIQKDFSRHIEVYLYSAKLNHTSRKPQNSPLMAVTSSFQVSTTG